MNNELKESQNIKRSLPWVLGLGLIASAFIYCGGLGTKVVDVGDKIPTWDGEIKTIMSICANCHQNPTQNFVPANYTFRFDIYTKGESSDGWDGAFEKKDRILDRAVNLMTMPPTTSSYMISPVQRALLEKWIANGAPKTESDIVASGN